MKGTSVGVSPGLRRVLDVTPGCPIARVAELADAQDLGSCAARREGSSPSSRILRNTSYLWTNPCGDAQRLGKNLVRILTTHCGGIARKGTAWPHSRSGTVAIELSLITEESSGPSLSAG